MANRLPAGFEALETWAVDWACASHNERWDQRLRSSAADLRAFYDALLPWLERILAHADEFPLGELPPDSARLFDLALMHAEIAPNVELYQCNPNVPHSFEERRFIAAHGNDPH